MDKTTKHKSDKKNNLTKPLKNKSLKYFNINLFRHKIKTAKFEYAAKQRSEVQLQEGRG
jgi:hypothetical protein